MAQKLFLVLTACLFAACGEQGGEITDIREVRKPDRPINWGVTSAQRFGFQNKASQHSAHGQGAGPQLTWKTPDGWKERRKTKERLANFHVAGDERAECYLTLLPLPPGGMAANVNRWRRQLGLEAIDDAAVQALPKKSLMGGNATLVDIKGAFAGMGSEPQAEYRMVGLILDLDKSALFMKMVGPQSVLDKEVDAFVELAASMRAGAGAQPDPHGGAPPPAPSSAAGQQPEFAWEVPEGWVQGPARNMRVVTFAPAGSEQAVCYVAVLGGAAGGVEPNLNRWRQQMGQKRLTKEEIKNLVYLEVLGNPSPMIQVGGDFTAQDGGKQASAALLGLVCELEGRTLFVKMTGPTELVKREKQRFMEFCISLQRRHP